MAAGVSIEGIDVDWEHRRELFTLDPAITYLNHGSFGVVPRPVQLAQQRLRAEMDANPMAFFTRGLDERFASTRVYLARFLGADPDCVALVANVTVATALVLNSTPLQVGDEVLLTDHGYGATLLATRAHCARAGAHVRSVSFDVRASDDEVVAALVDAVRPGRTRLAIVDQITSPTAKLLPVARISAALHELGVAVYVDGAHVPGMLPVDVAAIGADYWSGNLHKWAFAPRPTAMFVVAAHRRESIESLVVSWWHPDGFPGAVEFGGTLDYTAWLAAPIGVEVLGALDAERVRQSNVDLVRYGHLVVGEALGLESAELPNQDSPVPMRLLPLPASADDAKVVKLQHRLWTEHGCEVAVVRWSGAIGLRICAQIYNQRADYDRLASALTLLR
jgi:isopenicillin-N epimerase